MNDALTLGLAGGWCRLANTQVPPDVDRQALNRYRLSRIRAALSEADVPMALLSNPLSLRYAADIRQFSLFQARVPMMYLAVPVQGEVVAFGGLRPADVEDGSAFDEVREGRALTVFDGGMNIEGELRDFVSDMRALVLPFAAGQRIALDNMNPLVTRALLESGFDVCDAQPIMERARLIKSPEEITCMRWSIAVCEHAMAKMREVLRPGITENELWGLLTYVNVANDGEWHDSRQLTSGPRTNPFGQEASDRRIESGELVAFDTDMVGPYGYCADISRTYHCGPQAPSGTQSDLYRRAYEQLQHNIELLRPGVEFAAISRQAFRHPPGFEHFKMIMHGVGMSDENPMVMYEHDANRLCGGVLEPGMILCVEAYAGRAGGHEGVKLEDQVLITEQGCEVLSRFPFESDLLSD